MSALGADFYALKVAEYGSDVQQFASVFKCDVLNGDLSEAQEMLKKLEDQTWKLIDHAKTALEKSRG